MQDASVYDWYRYFNVHMHGFRRKGKVEGVCKGMLPGNSLSVIIKAAIIKGD